jgi:SSS family solute:Na+ symporter
VNIISSYNSTVIFICLLYVIIIGLYTARRVSADSSLYFFTEKTASWKNLSLSLFSLNFPAEYFLALAFISFSFRWAALPYEAVCFGLLAITMYCLFPLLMEEKITVSQEKLEIRFGRKTKLILSSISAAAGIFFRLSLILVTAGVLLYDILGWNYTTFILLIILASGIYSVAGGMISIVNLQLFQFILLIASLVLLAGLGVGESFSALASGAAAGVTPYGEYGFPSGINWIEAMLFIPMFVFWYWYNEHGLAQKIFITGDSRKFGKALAFSRLLKLVPVILFIAIGISARSFSPEARMENVMSSFVDNEALNILVRVVILFSLFSAIILALSSVFVSASTQITKDFLEPVYGIHSGGKLVLFSRFFISVLVIITIFLVPFTDLKNVNSYLSLLRFQLCAAAPLAAVYAVTLTTQKINSSGVITGLITGEALVIICMFMDYLIKPGEPVPWLLSLSAFRLAIYVFLISVITTMAVSHLPVSKIQFNNLFRKV